jgi:tetratricopeptide (TPR) repeat protein
VADGKQPVDDTGPTLTAVRSDAPPPAARAAAELGDGAELAGRYQLRDELARGGGGRIVLAYDRRLGRTVALKEPLASDPRGERLVREAKVMARLEHPAIVPVHDIGTRADGVPFYAMKLLGGRTLRDRISEAADFEQRIALLPSVIAIADAMAYAHSEGVVHRDLKPANVIIGEFGETAVIDWGLAKQVGEAGGGGRIDEVGDAVVADSVTRSDAVVGTPAYMPPEQAVGDPVSARADVYSLGALLYHVLAGAPPYRGADAASVVAALLAGPPPPLGEVEPRVPADLAAIAAKAMARQPADRYPTARELAEDLRHYQAGRLVAAHHYSAWARVRRWARGRRAGLVAAVAVLVAAGAVFLWWRSRGEDAEARCGRAGDPIAALWNPARASAARAAVLASGAPQAPAVWASVERMIDGWSSGWRSARVEACRDTMVHGQQSTEAMDLRMACLDRRLDHMNATLGLMDQVDRDQVDGLLRATAALPGFDECEDVEALRAALPLPDDPAVRARIEALLPRLAAVRAQVRAGDYAPARATVDEILPEARRLGWPMLIARAEWALGDVASDEGKTEEAIAALTRAELAADAARDDRVRAWAMFERLDMYTASHNPEAGPLLQRLEAVVARVDDVDARIALLDQQAAVADGAERHDEAIAKHEEALALIRLHDPDDLYGQATALGSLGMLYRDTYQNDKAEHYVRQSIALFEQMYGKLHPRVAASMGDLGTIVYQRDGGEKALPYFQQALETVERFHGPSHHNTIVAVANLGITYTTVSRFDDARRTLEEALVRIDANPVEKAMRGPVLYALADNEFDRGDYPEAERRFRIAVDFADAMFGPAHPQTLDARSSLGRALYAQQRHAEAIAELEPVLALREQTPGGGDQGLAFALSIVGRSHVQLQQYRKAIPYLERARAGLASVAEELRDTEQLGTVEATLARALVRGGGDRARARELARAAIDRLAPFPRSASVRKAMIELLAGAN